MPSSAPFDHEHENTLLERLTFFSDAVFAIAMTLLVVEVRLPHVEDVSEHALGQALVDLLPKYIAFIVSFIVVGRFWIGHHRIMGFLRGASPRLIWVNLFFLLGIAFMPFPTAVLSEHGQLRVGVGLYAGWLMVMGALNVLLNRAAFSDRRWIRDELTEDRCAAQRRVSYLPLIGGAVAFVLGMVQPVFAILSLMLALPVISWALRRGQPKLR